MSLVSSHLVPKYLHLSEKQRRIKVAAEMLSMTGTDMKCIITIDKTWIYDYDPERALVIIVLYVKRNKNTSEQGKNQGHVDYFLRLPWCCRLRVPTYWLKS